MANGRTRTMNPRITADGKSVVDYLALCRSAKPVTFDRIASLLEQKLPLACRDAYVTGQGRPTELVRIRCGTFQYIFDDYTALEDRGEVPYSPGDDGRVIVAFGRSVPGTRKRDDYRLRGWIGPTNTALGSAWDKGHFIAHSIGGAVDRAEINVFTQRRDLNRGWSEEGKTFRAMEEYCVQCPGTFCFARPLYSDGSSRPAFLEFGLCRSDGTLWVERFDNRGDHARAEPHARYTGRRKFGSDGVPKPRKPKK